MTAISKYFNKYESFSKKIIRFLVEEDPGYIYETWDRIEVGGRKFRVEVRLHYYEDKK